MERCHAATSVAVQAGCMCTEILSSSLVALVCSHVLLACEKCGSIYSVHIVRIVILRCGCRNAGMAVNKLLRGKGSRYRWLKQSTMPCSSHLRSCGRPRNLKSVGCLHSCVCSCSHWRTCCHVISFIAASNKHTSAVALMFLRCAHSFAAHPHAVPHCIQAGLHLGRAEQELF